MFWWKWSSGSGCKPWLQFHHVWPWHNLGAATRHRSIPGWCEFCRLESKFCWVAKSDRKSRLSRQVQKRQSGWTSSTEKWLSDMDTYACQWIPFCWPCSLCLQTDSTLAWSNQLRLKQKQNILNLDLVRGTVVRHQYLLFLYELKATSVQNHKIEQKFLPERRSLP